MMGFMQICSFLASATEILFALNLGDQVAGVTFECDYPAEAAGKPVIVNRRFRDLLGEPNQRMAGVLPLTIAMTEIAVYFGGVWHA